ncbi:MAG: response regulator [Nitrospinota bacterium]|nr:response regulator [Nitrospinota bacterium]
MKRVLIIDDDAAVRMLLKHSLEKLSYAIDVAENGPAGLASTQRVFYDLILLDVMMPKMDGYEVLQEIRNGSASAASPVIMVTALSDQTSVLKAMQLGACDYVIKPFDSGHFLHKVSRWANSREEAKWKKLEPEQEKALKLTLTTLDKGHDAVLKGRPLPYDDYRNTGREIVNVVGKNKVKPILEALKEHDSYTFVHSMRVGIFLSLFARSKKEFSDSDIATVTEGGIIHDVGKARTPLKVLNKPGAFKPHEWEEMKSHVNFGMEILKRTEGIPEAVMEICWNHHEKIDGTGYPRGLREGEIGTLARMSAIVDMYVALSDRRVYKPSLSHAESASILRKSRKQLDQALVEEFLHVVEKGGYA